MLTAEGIKLGLEVGLLIGILEMVEAGIGIIVGILLEKMFQCIQYHISNSRISFELGDAPNAPIIISL